MPSSYPEALPKSALQILCMAPCGVVYHPLNPLETLFASQPVSLSRQNREELDDTSASFVRGNALACAKESPASAGQVRHALANASAQAICPSRLSTCPHVAFTDLFSIPKPAQLSCVLDSACRDALSGARRKQAKRPGPWAAERRSEARQNIATLLVQNQT